MNVSATSLPKLARTKHGTITRNTVATAKTGYVAKPLKTWRGFSEAQSRGHSTIARSSPIGCATAFLNLGIAIVTDWSLNRWPSDFSCQRFVNGLSLKQRIQFRADGWASFFRGSSFLSFGRVL